MNHSIKDPIRFSIISLAISFTTVFCLLWINRRISEHYKNLGAKDQAWFGVIESINYSYKYIFAVPVAVSLFLALYAIRQKESWRTCAIALLLNLIAVGFIVVRLWKFMV
jgi:hypothetical protein